MTFYELLRSIASTDAVLDYIAHEYPADPGTRIGYSRVIEELLSLEPQIHKGGGAFDDCEIEGGTIVVQRFPPDELNEEPRWHVNLEDTAGQPWSMSFIPWAEYLGLDVTSRGVDLTHEQVLAHILWEITFFGWTADAVAKNSDDLRDTIDDLEDEEDDED
jgi:hypothetical protein